MVELEPREVVQTDDDRHRLLGQLLKEARRSIPIDATSFGTMLRFAGRIGKPVSQEEMAEAIGVSRVWYAMLETGRPIRASVALLERICKAFMMDAEQRALVFRLGVPEIRSSVLEAQHSPMLDASSRIRSVAKRLWAASTVEEALEIAAEETSTHFGDAALVFFVRRVAQGRWEHPFVVDRGMGIHNALVYEELGAQLTPARFDEVALYPSLSEPGDIGTRESFRRTSVLAEYEAAITRHKLQRWQLIHARVRSRSGVLGGITVKHTDERVYSEYDRAAISAIASLTSLALA